MPELLIGPVDPTVHVNRAVKASKKRGAVPTVREALPTGLVLVLEGLARLAAFIFVVAAAYEIYAVASGAVVAYQTHLMERSHWPELIKLTGNLGVTGRALIFSGIYLIFFTFIAAFEANAAFVGLAVFFGFCYFGAPMLFLNFLDIRAFNGGSVYNAAGAMILYQLQVLGCAAITTVALRAVLALIHLIRFGVQGVKKSRTAAGEAAQSGFSAEKKSPAQLFRHCWQLGYCQEFLLKVCPAWQRKKNCWKHGSGCLCDTSMMERLIQIEMGQAAGRRPPLLAYRVPKGPKKCTSCPIYLSHEEEKFRVVSPIIPVAFILLLVVDWDHILTLYKTVAVTFVSTLISRIALGPTPKLAEEWAQSLSDPVAMYSFVLCGWLILLSWALRSTEWIILDKKL